MTWHTLSVTATQVGRAATAIQRQGGIVTATTRTTDGFVITYVTRQ
jgi:hypothetical protein